MRDTTTGAYLLSANRSSNAESYSPFTFTNAQLAAAGVLGNGTPLQLDLVNNFYGGWGWVALSNVTINNVTPEPASVLTMCMGGLGLVWAVRAARRKRA